MSSTSNSPRATSKLVLGIFLVLALVGFLLGWNALRKVIFNVVTYRAVKLDAPAIWGTHMPAAICVLLLLRSAYLRWQSARSTTDVLRIDHICWPSLILLAGIWLAVAPTFVGACVFVVAIGASITCLTPSPAHFENATDSPELEHLERKQSGLVWLVSLVALVLASTVWHAVMQFEFWHRFMLGYADMGLFVNELEHCLPWREASERFTDTRMGYHCIPMFYLLVPFYALVRSPVFLMVVGPLLLNLPAIPFYLTARKRGAGYADAFLIACTWLLLPSISRLPYAGTYGFQSIYLAVPFLAWAWCLGMQGRWRASHVCLVLAMLCEETVCGVVLGWGVYLFFFKKRRRDGMVIALGAIAYLLLCTQVIIPHFTSSMTYTRLKLFGDVGAAEVAGRLVRPEVGYYLLALAVPLVVGLWKQTRMLIVIVPTLILVLLLRDPQYLNIKYWHQSSMLPLLFITGMAGVVGGKASAPSRNRGVALGLFVSVLLFHQLLGFSPLTQAYRLHATAPQVETTDGRVQAVVVFEEKFGPVTHTVLASERLAAHFWKYKAIFPLAIVDSLKDKQWPDVLIIDAKDGWDPIIAAKRGEAVMQEASARGFIVRQRFGAVFVLARE